MRWRRLVATPVGTALTLSSITVLAPVAVTAWASSPARPASGGASVAASGNGTEQPATALAPPQPPGPLPSIDELEAQMLSMVNAERAAAGAGPVQQVGWSHSVARQHAQDMAAAADIWHNITGFIDQGHGALRATYLGENVAMDSTLAADDALLYSDIPHRNVTLDHRFNTVGLGIALDSRNWVYVTEDFAQIPGWAAPRAAGPTNANAHAPVVVPAPVAPATIVRAAVARASVVTTNKPRIVAVAPAPAAVPAAAVAAVAVPSTAVPLVTAPAARPIITDPVSRSSAHSGVRSHPGPNSGGVWILLGLAGALMAAFGGLRFRTMLARGRRQSPAATTPGPKGSPSSNPSWRQAA
jgi:uncharacterized protein YkwD